MFDTHHSESKVVAVTQVVEKTITPDKITDLYGEIRKEVEKDIVEKLFFDTGELSGVVVVVRPESRNRSLDIWTSFKLNGKTYTYLHDNMDWEERMDISAGENRHSRLFDLLKSHYLAVLSKLFAEIAYRTVLLHEKI